MLARHRHRLWDAAPVALVLALGVLQALDEAVATPFNAAFAVALIWRRRFPSWSFAALSAIALAQWACDVVAVGDVALLFGFYTVVATEPWRRVALSGAVLQAGIVMAMLRFDGDAGGEWRGMVSLTAIAATAGALGLNARSRQALVASLRERAARLEVERDQRAELAVAAERARIAREMHDVVAHNLSVMVALSDGAAHQVDAAPGRARDAMERASRTGRAALDEMRRLVGVLRDDDAAGAAPRAPQPGVEEIGALVAQVRAAGLPVTLERAGGEPCAAPQGVQLAAYRIVQEALTNTLKHAGPGATAHVALRVDPAAVRVDIADTGAGVRVGGRSEGGGLRGMRERAAVYDGAVAAGPGTGGRGWRVTATLPFGAEVAA